MKLGSVLVALAMLAAVGFVGCDQEKKSPAPAQVIPLAPGETAPYEETAATKPPAQAVVTTPAAPAPSSAVAPAPSTAKRAAAAKTTGTTPKATVSTYKVLKGDTFSSISKKVYGSAKYAKKIYEANKNKPGVKSLDVVDEGVELKIP